MTSVTDMSRVLDILRLLYRHVETLEDFVDSIVFREGQKEALIQQSDTNRFKSFVRGVLVCFDDKLQQVPSCNEICSLSELLAFVLNSLKRKRKRNVLAHGYSLHSLSQEKRDADLFKFQGDITQSAAYIHGSDLWKKVAVRLGTDITRYLLESCSVFVSVPPSCVFQVCGVPVYDRVSTTGASSGFYLQARSRMCKSRPLRRCQGLMNLKRKIGNPKDTKKRIRREVRVGKRKRSQNEEEEVINLRKRRRLEQRGSTVGVQLDCSKTVAEELLVSGDATVSTKPLENRASSKPHVEKFTPMIPSEGEPSWRSGLFPPRPPSQCFIRTLGILYGGKGMHGFILNRKKKTTEGFKRLQGRDLLRIIFFEGLTYLNGVERKPKKLPRRFFKMVPLFNQLLHQHRRCPYSRILQQMCPLLEDRGVGQRDLRSLLPHHCASHRVYLFVRHCLGYVVPEEIWGSDHNRLHFFVRVRSFLRSGKFEKFSLSEIMWNMKVNDCDWLKVSLTGRVPPSELSYRTQVLGQFLAWLLDGYVVGLVRACFFVTESVGQKNTLKFYRQDVWAKLQALAFSGHLSKGQMEELTPAQVASLPKSTIVSHLRFIPKTDSMRPITRVIGTEPKTRVYQGRVRDLLDMLRACVRATPSLLGSTVWGMTDIHKALRSLALAQKGKPQPLYFVKADVSGAYESLPHDKLIEVIDQTVSPFRDKVFTVRRYAKIWADAHEGLKKSFVQQAEFLEGNMDSVSMKGFAMSLQRQGKAHHSILIEQHFCSDYRGREALHFFTQMLTGSVVQFGKKTYRQHRGIPQGSVVSSLLCCLCYGHMENVLFKGIPGNKGCLMRLVDDFLLITPDQHQAQTFLMTLVAGVPEYGLVVNPQKVVVNFEVSGSDGACPDVQSLPPHCLFPWCGLLLDTHSLDVHKDYSSYAVVSLRYSLTLGYFRCAGQQMRRKLMSLLRLKCHPLFLDIKTNSVEAVYKNIYKLVLLHARRFHVCAQSLPFGQTVAKNPVYFLQMIWDMADYANTLIRLSNKGNSSLSYICNLLATNIYVTFFKLSTFSLLLLFVGLVLGSQAQTGLLQYEAVELLFCLSFLLVLSSHRALYKDILPQLQKRKRSLEKRLGDLRLARIRQATNPRIPTDFLPIQT